MAKQSTSVGAAAVGEAGARLRKRDILEAMSRSVCVCICTRARPQELARTLASLARSTHPVARVVVSDDGPDDATRAACEAAPLAVTYVEGPRRGLGANRNHAMSLAREDFVLFLDDDCLLGEDFLGRALASADAAEARHGRGHVAVSGRERNHGRMVSAGAQTFLGFQARPYRDGEAMSSIVINATLFPRELLEQVAFDPQIVYGYDEVDLASRAVRLGWTIVPSPEAVNDHRPSARGREGYDAVLTASRLYVTFKRYALTERRPLRAGAYALVAPAARDRGRRSPRGMARGRRRRGRHAARAALHGAPPARLAVRRMPARRLPFAQQSRPHPRRRRACRPRA